MNAETTALQGVLKVRTPRFADARGWFFEAFQANALSLACGRLGLPEPGPFLQDNVSMSSRGVLRGLHFQLPPHAQGKWVRVLAGRAWDVVVDLRSGSPTCGKAQGFELSADEGTALWVPPGFAHGFLSLDDQTMFSYKVTAGYAPAHERTLQWNAADLGLSWPLARLQAPPLVSAKDASAMSLAEALAAHAAADAV
jgi:dTDP-4-dehydrorhamnose 3,5-epimerase